MTTTFNKSERNFRRFEGDINIFLRGYPETRRIDPQGYGLAATTVAARLRDALLSLKQSGWSTLLPYDIFLQHYHDIIVTIEDGWVILADRTHHRKEVKASQEAGTKRPTPTICPTVDMSPYDVTGTSRVMHALCYLCHVRAFSTGFIIINLDTDPNAWTSQYDIELTPQGEGVWRLV